MSGSPRPITTNNLSQNALTRFLKHWFGEEERAYKKYVAACQNETGGALLALWNREMPGRHADLQPHESGRENED